MILGRHIMVFFKDFQKSGLLVEIGHFEAFLANFGVTDLTLGHSRVAPKGFFLLYYPYPVPKLLAEEFLGLGPDLVHLNKRAFNFYRFTLRLFQGYAVCCSLCRLRRH